MEGTTASPRAHIAGDALVIQFPSCLPEKLLILATPPDTLAYLRYLGLPPHPIPVSRLPYRVSWVLSL